MLVVPQHKHTSSVKSGCWAVSPSDPSLPRMVRAVRMILLASNGTTQSWDADARAVGKSGNAVQTPSRKAQGFDWKLPPGFGRPLDHEYFVRRYNAARGDGRMVVARETELFAEGLVKRHDTSGRDYTSAGLKRRIRQADVSVPDGVIAADEGVSTTYVRRIRRG